MYDFLVGYILEIKDTAIVLEVNHVGYLVQVPIPSNFYVNQEKLSKIYIYQVVSENSQRLYGFATKDERAVFIKLLKVSGIGPKNAQGILANATPNGLINAVNNSDVKQLTKLPGIGKKTANQIILDLKDKFASINDTNDTYAPNVDTQELTDALLVLQSLGYSKEEIKLVKKQLLELDDDTSSDDYVKYGLKLLKK